VIKNLRFADCKLVSLTAHILDKNGEMKLTTTGNLEALGCVGVFHTKADIGVQLTVETVTKVTGSYMYLPSCPARGLSFTRKFMEMVGSEIFWNGIGSGFSPAQRVSPMWISAIPEIATIAPMVLLLLQPCSDRQIHTVC
jgi:hypothetical protein